MLRFCRALILRRSAAQTCRCSATARHPRFRGIQEGPVKESSSDLVTEDLLAEVNCEPVGIWSLKTSTGYLLISHSGPKPRTFRITVKFQKDRSIDSELNAWYSSHRSNGMQPCGGQCASSPNHPKFYDVESEGAPTLTPELRRVGCAGFCRKARKQSK